MLPVHAELELIGSDFTNGALLAIAQRLPDLANGNLLAVTSDRPVLGDQLREWAALTGHGLIAAEPLPSGLMRYVIRKGAFVERAHEEVGRSDRLWFYANFDCNLSCDYCCVRSSPTAARRRLDAETVRALVEEGKGLGFRQVLVTGGEPFLNPEIGGMIHACTKELPTTLLTNGMLFQGARLETLKSFPRDRLTLQISLDSPEPSRHDQHRGSGSWNKAWAGIQLARSLGFRVRIAATSAHPEHLAEMDAFLESNGFPPQDRVLRTIARRGSAPEGIPIVRADLVPELTVTAQGIYWHPVGADDDDLLITRKMFPLSSAWAQAQQMLKEDRELVNRLAEVFNCA
jgi:organic radical activating enzyme/TusA-related sulfurtransferase